MVQDLRKSSRTRPAGVHCVFERNSTNHQTLEEDGERTVFDTLQRPLSVF